MSTLIRIDTTARRAWHGDRLLTLGRREYGLLALLVQQPGTTSFDQIAHHVYQRPLTPDLKRSLHEIAAQLRHKLRDTHPYTCIVSVRGVGFRIPRDLVAPASQRVEINGAQYDVLHWERQPPHGATTVWTLYARPAEAVAR